MKKESKFQTEVIQEVKRRFPDCVVFKNDARQGFPDLLVLHETTWAALECKRNKSAVKEPNQEYYVDRFGKMSFAAFIHPENREEVLDDLQRTFSARGAACISQPL